MSETPLTPEDPSVVNRTWRDRGATAVEYALIIALIAAIIIGVVAVLGTTTRGMFQKAETELTNEGV